MPTLIPGVFPSDEDALPTPVLDDEPSARMTAAAASDSALPMPVLDDEPSARMTAAAANDGAPDKPRARSVSGEIRVPVRRAPSIKPLPDDDDDEPLIVIERSEMEVTSRTLPPRRRAVKSDPPELRARAGEVDLKSSDDRAIDDEPRIVIDEDALASESGPTDVRGIDPDDPTPPISTIEVLDDADTGAVIHDRIVDREPQPILLDRLRPSEQLPAVSEPRADSPLPVLPRDVPDDDDDDTGEVDIVVLDAPKRPRPERRTQLGVPPAPVNVRSRDAAAVERRTSDRAPVVEDPTKVDLVAAPPGEDISSDQIAAPPAPASDADTNPHVVAAPPQPAPPRIGQIRPAMIVDDGRDDDEDDDDEDDHALRGPRTREMTAAELDDAIPERASELGSDQLLRRRVDYDPVDDGWGPPGTTIPPPLLGAIPGSHDDDETSGAIPMPSIDSSPLIVGPSTPSVGDPSGRALARALEDATVRAIEVIRQLEHAQSRDEVVQVMVSYVLESHHRAGFFVTRHTVPKDPGELVLFAITPRPAAMPSATLRLDRPSTLQDIVGTRLPYRGPMHDEASRSFLITTLGACPPEILLVPVAVRERVVGLLFGEHRLRHTFDDQLALPARAAGMALERILRAKRG